MQPAPTLAETLEHFESVLSGRLSRDDADRWAAQWVASSDPPRMHRAIWRALTRLCGCDLRHGADGPYLHNDEQIREWSQELEAAFAIIKDAPPNTSLERTRDE